MRPFLKHTLSSLRPTREHSNPTVQWLLEHRSERTGRRALNREWTPLGSLYRMYEYLVVDYTAGLRTQIEFFFNQATWAVPDIQDPEDEDPKRYAILAVLTTYTCLAFNRLIEQGLPRGSPAIIAGPGTESVLQAKPRILEVVPGWAQAVPRLKIELVIPDHFGRRPSEPAQSEYFSALNIVAEEPQVFFA